MDTKTHIAYHPLIRGGIFALTVIGSIFLIAATVNQLRDPLNANAGLPTVIVSGTGNVFAIPDTAILSFDVQKEAKDVTTAQKNVNDIVSPIITDLKAKGVDEKDIKTVSYNSYPVYDYQTTPQVCTAYSCPPVQNQVLRGYQVTESIQVKVRKTDMAGDILTYLGTKKVTNMSGPNFIIDDEDAIKASARSKAIDDAKAKAQVLADQLGVRLVKIISFNEDGNSPYPMYERAVMSAGKAMDAVAPAPAEVPTGQNQYTSNVTITYEIR